MLCEVSEIKFNIRSIKKNQSNPGSDKDASDTKDEVIATQRRCYEVIGWYHKK